MKTSWKFTTYLVGILLTLFSLTLANAQDHLEIAGVTASDFQGTNRPENVLDGNLSTRWSAESPELEGEDNAPYIDFELSELTEVSGIRIAWFRGDQRKSSFKVLVSQNGVEYVFVFLSGESSGNTKALETYSFGSFPAKFVRILGFGNSDNRWNSITEVEIIGQPLAQPGVLPIEQVTASTSNSPHVPENTIDDKLGTRWSDENTDAYIRYQLDDVYAVSQVDIAFYKGDSRITDFSVWVSLNGTNWSWVQLPSADQGVTTQLVPYAFNEVRARYVEIRGYGNSNNTWTSITEVKIRGRQAALNPVAVNEVSASESQGNNVPERAIDGNLGTRWSAFGDEQHIEFALASETRVSQVDIAWFRGDRRRAHFTIQFWDDHFKEWGNVLFPTSSGNTLQAESYVFTGVDTTAIRIVGHGNSDNEWNSITEVNMFSIGD